MQTAAQLASTDLRRPRQQIWQPIVLGGFASVYGAMFFFIVPVLALAVFLGLSGVTVAYALRRRRRQLREAAGRALNAAFNLIGLGRLREAGEVLDVLEQQVREPWALRLADIQRAIIAIRRGEMAPAERHLSSAIARPLEGWARDNAAYQIEGAHALRAFVRASLGRHEEARADIAKVEAGGPTDDARARIVLAEAMLLEQQGKREELRLLLAERGPLLLEHTHPRERAIVRAFQRMVRADRASVYRRAEVVPRERAEGEEPMLGDWVAKVAPGAAEFVRSPRPAEQVAQIAPAEAVVRPTEAAVRANQEAKKPVRRAPKKGVLLGAAAAMAAVAVGTLLYEAAGTQAGAAADAAVGAAGQIDLWPVFLVPILAMPVIYVVARVLQWIGRRRAEQEVRQGPVGGRRAGPPAEEQLRALTESPSPVVAAQAWLLLADRAERRGQFEEVLAASTNGLARLSAPRDRAAADIVYPDLLSLRAFALSAQGRFQESNAELAMLGPAYPHHSRAVFRARLLMLVRSGDLRGAARWVEQGEADLPLSVREELLADLVRAAVSPEQAGAGEVQRLKDELAASPEAKSWIARVAPGLLETFEGATTTDVRMRIVDADPDADALAEEEAAAALEPSPFAPATFTRS